MTDTTWRPDLSQFPGPKYLALTRALREAIRAGILAEGAQLPTVRDLAWDLHVTPGTVSRAYQLATQEGLLAATVGRGTFVAARAPRLGPTQALFQEHDLASEPWIVDLRSPQLPDVGQNAVFAAALRRIAEDMPTDLPDDTASGMAGGVAGGGTDDEDAADLADPPRDPGLARHDGRRNGPLPDWLDYPSQRAEEPLRVAVCDWLRDSLLGPFGPEDVALTHGGQNALLLVFLCCLRGDRPVILAEDLAYPGIRHAARLVRAETVGIELDDQGIVPEALEAACRRHSAQLLVVTPEAQNPTASRMSAARRQQIAAIARRYDLQIVEDDCYSVSESRLPSLRALAPERAWYVGSFSKSVSPALRFGYIVCPQGMGEAGRLTAQHGFFALARPVSDLCLELLQSGAADRLRQAVRAQMAVRQQCMVNALGAFDVSWQPGLPFVWVRLPMGWRGSTFARAAESEGVLVRQADEYALIHGRAPHALRIAISGTAPLPRFEQAVETIARLLARPPADMMAV